MIRIRAAMLFGLLFLAVPALASPFKAPPAQHSNILIRAVKGVVKFPGKVLGGLARSFKISSDMKQTLAQTKEMRKLGMLTLTGQAEMFRDEVKPQGLRERFAAWRVKKGILRAARKELRARSLTSDPQEGYAATATLVDAGKTSFIDRLRANSALKRGTGNAVRNARRLAKRGEFDRAAELLAWSVGEREAMDRKTLDVMMKLNARAMKAADRAATRYAKAGTQDDQLAALDMVLKSLDGATRVAQMASQATGQELFDQARAERIAKRMNLSLDQLGRLMQERRTGGAKNKEVTEQDEVPRSAESEAEPNVTEPAGSATSTSTAPSQPAPVQAQVTSAPTP